MAGSDSKTGYGWMRLGADSWYGLHRAHAPRGLVESAFWHSHPPGSLAQPSRADLKAWHTSLEAAREIYGRQVEEFVGLIITPGNARGTDPTIHAWIVTDHGDAYASAEPAFVKIGGTTASYSPANDRQRFTLEPTHGGVCTSERISDNTYQRSNGSQEVKAPMLVATRSFTTRYDGKLVEIRAGVSRVATSHELALDGTRRVEINYGWSMSLAPPAHVPLVASTRA